jgi:hypothetical protein
MPGEPFPWCRVQQTQGWENGPWLCSLHQSVSPPASPRCTPGSASVSMPCSRPDSHGSWQAALEGRAGCALARLLPIPALGQFPAMPAAV